MNKYSEEKKRRGVKSFSPFLSFYYLRDYTGGQFNLYEKNGKKTYRALST